MAARAQRNAPRHPTHAALALRDTRTLRRFAQSNPLYIRAFNDFAPDELRFQHFMNVSLDSFEEKIAAMKAPPSASPATSSSSPSQGTSRVDSYLGLLYPIEQFLVYGYLTNTQSKLIAVVLDHEDPRYGRIEVKEEQMKALFRRLHTLYVDTICNPFYNRDEDDLRKCASFDRQVERIVEAGLY